MQSARSARYSATRYRRRRRSSTRDLDDEIQCRKTPTNLDDELQDLSTPSSRPSTQDSRRSSYSRLSTDSGEGSLEDFSRRNSSPVFCRDGPGRRHTAPTRKSSPSADPESRPNTVHELLSARCSLSRYAPLPAIGSQQQLLGLYELERPAPVRRQCFMGPLDIPIDGDVQDVNDNGDCVSSKPVFAVALDSEVDSDFEDESNNQSDVEDADSKPKRPILRSATFTIEKERPDVHGPFLDVAVRLPSGCRVTKRFDCKETLWNVCDFALQGEEDPEASRWALVTTDFPKRMFKDLTMSLKEAEIDDKSLLYLQARDESDSD